MAWVFLGIAIGAEIIATTSLKYSQGFSKLGPTIEEFETKLAETVKKTIRDMGFDSLDRKHGGFPTKDDPEGDTLKYLPKEQRVKVPSGIDR